MLIRRIQARGFMRYDRIDIQELPARGVIAVLGENESGKSTLGECVAFGLFGETIKTRATDVSQAVGWDHKKAWVQLDLELSGRRRYQLARKVDKRGGHEASLSAIDGSERVDGPGPVAARLGELGVPSFEAFRLSFYLGQQEVDLLRRDRSSGVRVTIEAILGLTDLERAAANLRGEAQELTERHDALAKDLAVAEEVAQVQAATPRADALRVEASAHAESAHAAELALPEARSLAARTRAAVAARAAAGQAFNELSRALTAHTAKSVLTTVGAEIAGLARWLDADVSERTATLARAREAAAERRGRIDRLIGYRTEIAKFEARLELYKNEVRRNLEAPQIEDDEADLLALDGLAMPSTPAAGLRLAEARVKRVRTAKTRAQARSVAFVFLAILLGALAFPAVSHLVDAGQAGEVAKVAKALNVAEALKGSEAHGRLTRMAQVIEQGLGAVGIDATRHVWAGIALAGGAGFASCLLLTILGIAAAIKRGDELKLSVEAQRRLREEVDALDQELQVLDQLNAKAPRDLSSRIRELRNPSFHEAYDALNTDYPEFVASEVQGKALVQAERAEEAELRSEVSAFEEALGRLTRVARSLPTAADSPYVRPGATVARRDPAFESRAAALLERFERSRRDHRDAMRGGATVEPAAGLDALDQELSRVLCVATDPAASRAASELRERLAALVGRTSDDPDEVEARLRTASERLDEALPSAKRIIELREEAEAREHALAETYAVARARGDAARERLVAAVCEQDRQRERIARVEALRRDVAPLARDLDSRSFAAELLSQCAGAVRESSGPRLAAFTEAILPRLTNGRYRRVQVSPSLEIKVYSPDKNDFVPIVDLSMGACDQLLLTLRLGLGLVLLKTRGALERHFLFLDEPLASFDAGRAHAFLELLRASDSVFPQVFVIAHHHHGDLEPLFDRVIRTDVGSRTLLSCAGETGTMLLEASFDDAELPEDDVELPEDDVELPEDDVELPEDDVERPEDDVERPEDDAERPEDAITQIGPPSQSGSPSRHIASPSSHGVAMTQRLPEDELPSHELPGEGSPAADLPGADPVAQAAGPEDAAT